jgi:hypothetical protein
MAAAATAQALDALAAKFEAENCPQQAVACLLGLLGQSLLPDAEVRARLQLARLLMRHTHNLREAKTHLQRAVRARRARRDPRGGRGTGAGGDESLVGRALPGARLAST